MEAGPKQTVFRLTPQGGRFQRLVAFGPVICPALTGEDD